MPAPTDVKEINQLDATPGMAIGDLIHLNDASNSNASYKDTIGAILDLITGDITVNSSGVASFGSGVIVDADINASAAIAQSKLSLDITNANINASAAIALSKLATDPLARTNHTGTQAFSTITGTVPETQGGTNQTNPTTGDMI
jgi:hypothetical protein